MNNGKTGNGELILKIFAGVCAAIYAFMAVRQLIGVLGGIGVLFNTFRFGIPMVLAQVIAMAADVLTLVAYIWMLAALLLILLKRTPENSDGLLALTIGGVVVVTAVKVIALVVGMLVTALVRRYAYIGVGSVIGNGLKDLLLCMLGAAVAAGGTYGILRLVMGENPLAGKDLQTLMDEAKLAVADLTARADAAAQSAKESWDAQAAAKAEAAQAEPTAVAESAAGAVRGVHRLKTNRGLLMYILLSIVTCGIYGWVFIHGLARDVNTVCEGDGRHTGGLLKFILLNLITCNIYSWVWYYGLGNRLAANAPRYELNFQENGTTILLWMLVGVLLCGIGPLVAIHIICKNTNALCGAYNAQNGV